MPLDAGQLRQQAVDELATIEAEIEGLRGEKKAIDEKIDAKEVARKEAQRIVSALTPRAKRGEGKKAQAKKRAEGIVPTPGPTGPVEGTPTPVPVEPEPEPVDPALQAQVPASGTQPVGPFIPPAS